MEFDRLLTAAAPDIERAARKYAAKYRRGREWQDIAQTVFLKMLRAADQYDPAKGELLPWACVIIINTIINTLERHQTILCTEALNKRVSPVESPEDVLQMKLMLANLNPEARLYVEGYNYAEIAAKRGVKSKATVMTRIDKCTKHLSLIMGRNCDRGRRSRTSKTRV